MRNFQFQFSHTIYNQISDPLTNVTDPTSFDKEFIPEITLNQQTRCDISSRRRHLGGVDPAPRRPPEVKQD